MQKLHFNVDLLDNSIKYHIFAACFSIIENNFIKMILGLKFLQDEGIVR